ncbi:MULTISPECIES: helix-turn-helix domain-containing protein [unclassified Nocardia]|uniref:helix-turn-helix domain-containing protein n=1 Tax=unclassified Nocardia TaxID=2637762 RepID=UPI001CE46D5D|nr:MULTISPECIES: helix-turn-helix domain-containing protein [unclassified Nocardia]
MPGGRLTQEDRRHIAGGLARGLGYAEIARQLARPTSTVSREVMRNGGPSRYRPDIAHRATERRARRRKPAIPSPGPKDAAAQEFLEHFGKLFRQSGMPRMSANVLACLYDSDSGSAVAAELAARLRVSRRPSPRPSASWRSRNSSGASATATAAATATSSRGTRGSGRPCSVRARPWS